MKKEFKIPKFHKGGIVDSKDIVFLSHRDCGYFRKEEFEKIRHKINNNKFKFKINPKGHRGHDT